MKTDTGILITNIGSPDAPTTKAVRYFLKKFLSDKRVVSLPRFLWYPILYGIILPFRSPHSATLYQKIWTEQGSPLTYVSTQLAEKLQTTVDSPVAIGMHYGNPSIHEALEKLRAHHVKKIIALPLYPQYSATTTAATFDVVAKIFQSWNNVPEIHFLHDYADHPHYISALCHSIQHAWQTQGKPQHLLFSFHGIPQHHVDLGDPYLERCELTASLVATQLQLPKASWSIAFQSRLGRGAWLQPYTDHVLKALPRRGITTLHVICPGFAVDCLETLEEMNIRGRKQFLSAGGELFHYIPALNDSEEQLGLLKKIVLQLSSELSS